MPLTKDIQLISVDDHLIEPPGVWVDRVASKFQERCPRVTEVDTGSVVDIGNVRVQVERGSQVWRYEDAVIPQVGLSATAGTPLEQRNFDPVRFDQMRRGAWDSSARLADMDQDGVWVHTCFPSFAGFAGSRFLRSCDMDLALACVRAYNDFVLDEWCAADRKRYIPVVMLPLWDMALSVTEIERCASKGARAITFPDHPSALGLPAFHTNEWDSVFAAAAAAALPLCMHFGSGGVVPYTSPGSNQAAQTCQFGLTLYGALAELVFSEAFHRNPDLKIALSEGGIGWLPYAMQRIDQVWQDYRHYDLEPRLDADTLPSDLIRRHVWSCFIDDQIGLDLRHEIGVERVVWESDYPHADSLWPNSRSRAEQVFADIPDDEVKLIVEGNARELFSFL